MSWFTSHNNYIRHVRCEVKSFIPFFSDSGITDDVDRQELLTIADNNEDRVFQVYDFDNLNSIMAEVVEETRVALPIFHMVSPLWFAISGNDN